MSERYLTTLEENIVPSQTPEYAWMQCIPDKEAFDKADHATTGKWMIRTDTQEETDALWPIFKKAMYAQEMGDSMKSSTKLSNNGVLTCIYTNDWRDIQDIRRVLRTLRKLGITGKIYYKSDEQTLMLISGSTYVSPYRDIIEMTQKGREWYEENKLPAPPNM